MTKHQLQIEEIPAADLLPSYNEVAALAMSSGFIQRESSKLCPLGFLLVLIKATITGKSTLEGMASDLGALTESPMSRSGFFQRFNSATVRFLISVLYQILAKSWELPPEVKKALPFSRLLIEDSTQLWMNPKNAEEFPGHGNGSGPTAGCKVDFCYDLLNSSIVDMSLHLATDQDKELGKDVVNLAQAGDCFLRDMGYFASSEFDRVEQAGAYWLSRLPAGVHASILTDNESEILLEEALANATSDSIDVAAKVGKSAGKSARTVVIKADKETVERRQRERNARDKKSGKKSSKRARERDKWHIMATNIPEEMMSVKQLAELYRLRWNIELSFKAWKQSGSMLAALGRKANAFFLESLVVASMIRFALSFRPLAQLRLVARISMDKLFKRLSEWLSDLNIISFNLPFREDLRHISKDLRRRGTLDQLLGELMPSLA